MALAEPTKKLVRRLVSSKQITSSVGTTGGVGIRIRRNVLMRALLNHKLSESRKSLATIDGAQLRDMVLQYVEANRIKSGPYGRFRYSLNGSVVLYSSLYAALTKHLYSDLDTLSGTERKEWVNTIQGYQREDGLFRDPAVANEIAETADWWGWRHMTLHAVMALTALDAIAEKEFRFLSQFRDHNFIRNWIRTRDWKNDAANVSNEVQNFAALLQYARDFHDVTWAYDSMGVLYEELDRIQDEVTGLWGPQFNTPALLSNGVQTAYHLLLLYFYDKRPIRFTDKIVDSCLRTQNELGGFSPFLNSSACEDIDSIDPLMRLSHIEMNRVRKTMQLALPWVYANMNADGGFVFRRLEPFLYGHENMFSGINVSSMFPTWFRSLSLAYISMVLKESSLSSIGWRLLKCPGYQFQT